MTLFSKSNYWFAKCLVLIVVLHAVFSSCKSDVGKVQTKMLTTTVTTTGTTLSWTAPTTYTDGVTALSVSSYNLYYRTSLANNPTSTSINGSATTFDAAKVITTRGVIYYFHLTALDAAGLESDPSNEVSTFAPN